MSPAVKSGSVAAVEITTTGAVDSYARAIELYTDNTSKSTAAHKIVSRVYYEPAQFYAGNERSTSLVTAIPADIYDSSSVDMLNNTTSLLLDKILFNNRSPLQLQQKQPRLRINTSIPENGHGYPQDQREECFLSRDKMNPRCLGSADSFTLREPITNSFQALSFLTHKDESGTSSTSAHVHFASPLALINAYTPEYDTNSSIASAIDVGLSDSITMGLKRVTSPDMRRFWLSEDTKNTPHELAEVELEEQCEIENQCVSEDAACWYRHLRLIGAIANDISSSVVPRYLDVVSEMSEKFFGSALVLEPEVLMLMKKKMSMRYDWTNVMAGRGSLGLYTGTPSGTRLSASSTFFLSPSPGSPPTSHSLYLCSDSVD